MSNGYAERPADPSKQDVSENNNNFHSRRNLATEFCQQPAVILLRKIQILVLFVTRIFTKLLQQGLKWSRRIKSSITIAALVATAILAGHVASAQVSLSPLSQVKVPEPNGIGNYIRDKTAAIALGKSLFWDMQLGTDGVMSCATCHFHAGADSRSKNQLNPGSKAGDTVFNIGGRPNYQLAAVDFPFHKLADPNNRSSNVVSDSNDVTGSQGVFRADFVDIVPGNAKDNVTAKKDDVFNVQGTNVRRVTGRNTPTVINAVFNFRNFWDGRAQNIFNGVNALGLRDPDAFVLKASNPRRLEDVRVSLDNSSLASQAVAPPLDGFETAAEDLPIAPLRAELSAAETTVSVTDTKGQSVGSNSADLEATNGAATINSQNATNGANSSRRAPQPTKPIKRIGRKLGKKLLALQPLAKQQVHRQDSVLASYRAASGKGLNTSYEALIQKAFKPEWWRSNLIVRVDPNTGERTFYRKPRKRPLSTIEYTLPEYNFSLFFGLAVQAYESTLVANQTPFDQFLAGTKNALTAQQQQGFNLFQNKGLCIGCHAGAELTAASISRVASTGRITRAPIPGNPAEDTGFFQIGVRPTSEDPGVGGNDDLGNSLSEVRLAQQGKFKQLLGQDPPTLNPPLSATENVVADGAFKAPGLRNVELTSPYFHNGGQLTLRQVVDFYSRGGDFGGLPVLNLSDEEKEALVAFLRGLTDERVRFERAPFDHPQLFVPNGHPGDRNAVVADGSVKTSDGTQQATDALLEIPSVGRNGGNPLPNFLSTYSTTGTSLTR